MKCANCGRQKGWTDTFLVCPSCGKVYCPQCAIIPALAPPKCPVCKSNLKRA